MAMTIFFVLNGLGLLFLLYVLAKFWQEGRHSRKNSGTCAVRFGRRNWAVVVLPTRLNSVGPKRGPAVLPFPTRDRQVSDRPILETASHRDLDERALQISTR